jgi:hypothetical protein
MKARLIEAPIIETIEESAAGTTYTYFWKNGVLLGSRFEPSMKDNFALSPTPR